LEEDIFKHRFRAIKQEPPSIPAIIGECFGVSSELVLSEVNVDQAVGLVSEIRGKVRIQRLE